MDSILVLGAWSWRDQGVPEHGPSYSKCMRLEHHQSEYRYKSRQLGSHRAGQASFSRRRIRLRIASIVRWTGAEKGTGQRSSHEQNKRRRAKRQDKSNGRGTSKRQGFVSKRQVEQSELSSGPIHIFLLGPSVFVLFCFAPSSPFLRHLLHRQLLHLVRVAGLARVPASYLTDSCLILRFQLVNRNAAAPSFCGCRIAFLVLLLPPPLRLRPRFTVVCILQRHTPNRSRRYIFSLAISGSPSPLPALRSASY